MPASLYSSREVAKEVNKLRNGYLRTPLQKTRDEYEVRLLRLVKGEEVGTAVIRKFLREFKENQ